MQGHVCPSERGPVLFTERLILHHWRESDREPFARLNADLLVMEYMPHALSKEDNDVISRSNRGTFSTAWLRLVCRGTSTKWQLPESGGNDGWHKQALHSRGGPTWS
jgi:hypothetical protein